MRLLRLGLPVLVLGVAACGPGPAGGAGAAPPARPTPVPVDGVVLVAPDRLLVRVLVGTCGRRGTGSARVEQDAAQVRLTAYVVGFDPPARGEACTVELAIEEVTVGLARPLGDRPVVDTSDGAVLRLYSTPRG